MSSANRRNARHQSTMMAFCGMTAGVSVVIMLLGAIIPVFTYAAPLLCGLLLLPIMAEFGKKAAWTTFGVTALIALILGVDKEAAFFYLFIGWYPLVKWQLDRIRSKPVRLLCKLAVFTVSITAMYALLAFLLHMDAVVQDFAGAGPWLLASFVILFNVCMFLYDLLLFPMLLIYSNRIKPKLTMLRR